jgi:hypothetical protein
MSTPEATVTAEPAELVALPEDEAREAINRWSDGFFRIRFLGDKIFLNKVTPCYSYNVRLRTQYEERNVVTACEPYHGQQIDNYGRPPEPWSIEVRCPNEYEERSEIIRVPHTDRISRCPQCAGVGEVSCRRCHGTGQTACSWCGGMGFIQRMEMQPGPNIQGQPSMRPVMVRSHCPSCFNGRVSCSTCGGNGRITCSTCEGTCQVCLFEQLTVRFRNKSDYEVLDTTEVPDENFEKLKGEAIFARHAPRVEGLTGVPPTVEQSGKKLLRASQAVDEREARVLFQDLAIERVPVNEVQYMYAGVDRRLWIYGDGHVYAPGAPWRRDRLWTILAAVAGVLVLAGVLFAVFSR